MQINASRMTSDVRIRLLHRSAARGSEDLAREAQCARPVEPRAFEPEGDATLLPDEDVAGETGRGVGEEHDMRGARDPETGHAGRDLHPFDAPRRELLDQVGGT